MENKLRFAFSCLLFLLATVACSPIKVINQESAQDFTLQKFRTFEFLVEDSTLTNAQASPNYQRFMQVYQAEVARQLSLKGLTRDQANPQLLLNLGMVVEEKAQTRQTNYLTDAPRYIGQRRYTWKSQEVEVGRYKEGTISLHLIDKASNELVWQGEAEAVIPKKVSPLEDRLKQAVQALFERIK